MRKKLNFLFALLLLTGGVVGCGDDDEVTQVVEETPQITLSATGLEVPMAGEDVERTFTVTSDITVSKDLLITVSTNASATDATLLTPNVVISKGETTTTGKIKFLGTAFPLGAELKDIKVSITSETATVASNGKEVVYAVKGSDKPIAKQNATMTCATTDVFVAGTNVNIPVTIKLDAPAEQYTEFRLVYGPENTITEGSWTSISPIFIDKGEKEITFDVVFAGATFTPGVKGVSHLKLTSEIAIIDNQLIKLNVAGVTPNAATVSAKSLNLVVGDGDLSETITVTLAENALADATFDVSVEGKAGDFEVVNKVITVKKGEKIGTGVIKFLKKAFPIELMTGTAIVTVTASSSGTVMGEPSKLLFNIKGTGTAPMGAVTIAESNLVKVEATDKVVEFTVHLSEAIQKAANFTVTATGDKANSFTLNNASLVVAQGATTAKGTITFKASSFPFDTDKAKIKLSIASEDVIVINSGSSIDFKVSGAKLNPNKEDIKYEFDSRDKVAYVGKTGKTKVQMYISSELDVANTKKEHTITAEITGGIEGVDYEFTGKYPIVIDANKTPYSYLYINVLPAAAGKELVVEMFSDEATIGAHPTQKIEVKYIDWMPTTRSAPKAVIGDDSGTYAVKAPKVNVNGVDHAYTYPMEEWNDFYDTKSFGVKKGAENKITISAFSISDKYYLNYTYMVVYADFNNDGDFSDAGEKVALKKMEGLAIGEANIHDFSTAMTVPEGAAQEFAIRVGLIIATATDINTVFKNGYFIEPGSDSNIRMSDFKAVIK
ncbi:MAG: hypothetical protein RR908_02065 [Rikenellaceae bacterium]